MMKLKMRSNEVLRALAICLALLLLLSPTAFASSVQLSASSESGAEGDTVSVSIGIENASGTEGGQFELNFDPDVVVPADISKGEFVSSAANDQFNYNLEFDGSTLMVIWVTPAGDTSDSGTVCTIDFEIVGDGESSLTFSGVVLAPEGIDVAATHSSGSITSDEVPDLQAAIDAANEAIANLPDPDDITLGDKPDVQDARDLVNAAMDLGATDNDFDDLGKLEDAEAMIAKLEAIKAADDAIVALPTVEDLTLDDKPAVVAARALVSEAKDSHGAVDGDFTYLSILQAAENRIKELEGQVPTPPTGGMGYIIATGLALIGLGAFFYLKRQRYVSANE